MPPPRVRLKKRYNVYIFTSHSLTKPELHREIFSICFKPYERQEWKGNLSKKNTKRSKAELHEKRNAHKEEVVEKEENV